MGRAWCYSITWPTRSRSVCGIVSPSDLGGDARRPARGALTLAMDFSLIIRRLKLLYENSCHSGRHEQRSA